MNTTFGTVGGKPNVTYLQPPSAQTMFNNPQQSMFGNAPQQPMGTFPSMGQQPLGMGQQPLGMGQQPLGMGGFKPPLVGIPQLPTMGGLPNTLGAS